MSSVRAVLDSYLTSENFTASDFDLGGGSGFATKLEAARRRNRVGFWISVVVLLVLFIVVLSVSYRDFDQLIRVGPTKVTGVFGISTGGIVTLMLHLFREASRADYLLVLLGELRDLDPKEFVKVARAIAKKWYGLPT
jgi:hypothetical protein